MQPGGGHHDAAPHIHGQLCSWFGKNYRVFPFLLPGPSVTLADMSVLMSLVRSSISVYLPNRNLYVLWYYSYCSKLKRKISLSSHLWANSKLHNESIDKCYSIVAWLICLDKLVNFNIGQTNCLGRKACCSVLVAEAGDPWLSLYISLIGLSQLHDDVSNWLKPSVFLLYLWRMCLLQE